MDLLSSFCFVRYTKLCGQDMVWHGLTVSLCSLGDL